MSERLTDDPEIPVRLVRIWLCDLCLDGHGGECHSPGCALWINRAPDIGIRNSPFVTVLDGDQPAAAAAEAEARQLREVVSDILGVFGPSGSGMTARVGREQVRKWRERAGLES